MNTFRGVGTASCVQTELDEVLGCGRRKRSPTLGDIFHVHYTRAMISEVQRQENVIPNILPQVTQDWMFRGYFIAKNVIRSYFFESCNFLLKQYSLGKSFDTRRYRLSHTPKSDRMLQTCRTYVNLFVLTSEVIDDDITFYARAKKYYMDIPPTEESMLGGYTEIADADIAASRKFMKKFLKPNKGGARKEFALDCGAGIGRTTKYLLLPIFSRVDMVDMIPLFLRIARKSYLKGNIRRVHFICSALQDFRPQASHYDVVWIQWVTGHLTDDDLLELLRRCRRALRQDGILIIKDNVAHEGVHIDVKDSSVCRARPILTAIFHRAGLRILCEEPQMDFPGEILPVWMFALR